MRKLMYLSIFFILVMSLIVAGPSSPVFASRLNAVSPILGDVASYSVLAGSIVTNTGPTTVLGDVGVSPSIGVPPHVTGFPPGIVNAPGAIHDTDAHAAAAQAADTIAFGALDQPCDFTYPGVQDLTLVSPLAPGTYCAVAFELSGNLTLEASGVYIFKSESTLITAPNSSVTGGDPCNVWWRVVSSATLDTGTSFMGNILALTSIALETGATLNGRALAQTGAVTLDNNTISAPPCYVVPTPTVTATSTATATATATAEGPTATATATSRPRTATSVPPTATATNLPVVTALPPTGGAPLQSDGTPWGLLIAGGVSALTLLLGVRTYRKSSKPRL